MYAFALCTDLDVPRAFKVPPPLPRTVAFTPSPDAPGQFDMRQAKFFNEGQVLIRVALGFFFSSSLFYLSHATSEGIHRRSAPCPRNTDLR